MVDYTHLIAEYRKIWNNRSLAVECNAEDTLKQAILRELKDENSHPRVRRPLFEKYYWATKRIMESCLADHDKLELIGLHIELAGNYHED
ncbi:hypothetical protein CVD19_04285 [Bacillus sp. T33-2]|nr:hypothetical protein CVD19_04285 [Bacillus sp. T33-2]